MQTKMDVVTTITLNKEELRVIGLALLNNSLTGDERKQALDLNVELNRTLTEMYDTRAKQLQKQTDLAIKAKLDDATRP